MNKKEDGTRPVVSFRAQKSDVAYVKEVAVRRRMTESEVYRMLLEVGVGAHKDAEKLGIVYVADFIHFIRKSVKEKVKSKIGVKAV